MNKVIHRISHISSKTLSLLIRRLKNKTSFDRESKLQQQTTNPCNSKMKIKALNRLQRRKASTHRKTGPNHELARAIENRQRLQSWNRNCD
jgi:hypothetical protein